MGISRCRFALTLVCFCFVNPILRAQAVANGKETVAAAQVGKDVEAALTTANSTGLAGLTLTKAVLTLETTGSVQGGIKLNFLIFTIDHTKKKGTTITQTLTFGALQKPAGGGEVDLS